jgi:hypothetical protein
MSSSSLHSTQLGSLSGGSVLPLRVMTALLITGAAGFVLIGLEAWSGLASQDFDLFLPIR